MPMIQPILQELDQEAATTRRVLERVPDDRLDWRPHPKARTLGQLAMHVAIMPGAISAMATSPTPSPVPTFTDPIPTNAAELITTLDQGVEAAHRLLDNISDATLMEIWRMEDPQGTELFALPRMGLLRVLMLNHWYHHRGQLSVYLRELDIPVPSIYGPSADENPFAVSA
jgi:uncharacterized damage-inducible protein DinB